MCTIKGKKVQVSPTVIKCKGKKPDCVTGAGGNLPAPQEAIDL